MAMFGETLRQARAHKGVTLKEAEQATRINRHHLAALEEENFSALPPLIYQRGIVRNYAAYLDLDSGKLLTMFEEAHGGVVRAEQDLVSGGPPLNMPTHWAPNFAIIAFALVLGAIVFAWAYSGFVAPTDAVPTTTQPLATVTPFDQDVALPTEPPRTPTPTATPLPPETPQPEETVQPRRASTEESEQQPTRRSGGDNQRQRSTEEPEPTAAPEETEAEANEDSPTSTPSSSNVGADGEYVTSIAVTAQNDIYVEIVADDVLAFSGDLSEGQSSEQIAGSVFEVYTSSGENTQFTNACDEDYFMGREAGEARYILTADEGSCAPVN